MSDTRLRWIVFALSAAAFFLSFFHRVAPAAVAAELTAAFAVSGAALGALAATYFYVYAAMQLPTGVLVDTIGPRRVLTAGCLLAGAGSMIFATAGSLAAAAAGRTLVGLGVSVAFVSLLKLSAAWFEERRFATVSGFGNVIGLMGAVAATAPLAWLVTVVSWRTVFVAVGAVSLAFAAAIWFLVRDRPRPDRGVAQPPAPMVASERWWHGLAEVVGNRATWPGFWINFGVSGSYMSFIGLWAVPFLTQVYGMSPIAASQHTSVMIIASAVSLAGVGLISDHFRRRRPLIMGSATLYLACWIAWLAGIGAAWTYVMAALMGFSVSGFSLAWACAKEVNRPRYAGMAISLANIGGFLAAGILQPLVGWMLDMSADGASRATTLQQFRPALAVLALFALIGLIGSWFIRETHCRNIWVEKSRASLKSETADERG
jgi:MFS family permease